MIVLRKVWVFYVISFVSLVVLEISNLIENHAFVKRFHRGVSFYFSWSTISLRARLIIKLVHMNRLFSKIDLELTHLFEHLLHLYFVIDIFLNLF